MSLSANVLPVNCSRIASSVAPARQPRCVSAILFDMDGVLIDAKDWHYLALNEALELFGMEISRDEHLAVYDGLPTRKKLDILTRSRGLPPALHEFINEIKQAITIQLTLTRCRPIFQHQYALAQLKAGGFRLAVCSNSIRATVQAMMEGSRLASYFDLMLSNQDVSRAKPHPDIYLAAMERLQVQPEECLIVEDNEHGIQAARASGGHVMMVGSVYDVTLERIVQEVHRVEGLQR